MGLSIKVDLPQFPKGEMVGIEGLGRFENGGKAVEISEEDELRFVQSTGGHVRDILDTQEGVTITGTRSTSDKDIPEPAVVGDVDSNGEIIKGGE